MLKVALIGDTISWCDVLSVITHWRVEVPLQPNLPMVCRTTGLLEVGLTRVEPLAEMKDHANV